MSREESPAAAQVTRYAAPALFLAGLGVTALVLVASLAFHDGLRSPTLGFCGLVVCLLCGVKGLRWGAALALICIGEFGALAWAEATGSIARAPHGMPLAFAFASQCLLIAGGLAGGMLLTRVLDRYLAAAAEREMRFRKLLDLAVDWYWEQDEQFRFTHV